MISPNGSKNYIVPPLSWFDCFSDYGFHCHITPLK
jgi:hypothetical protein